MKTKKIISTVAAAAMAASCIAPAMAKEETDLSVQSYYTSSLASSDNGDGTFSNPVLYTDVADPDVICAPGPDGKEAYYMVSTAMSNSPGCPIMKSTDLVNWETVSYLYDSLDFENDALALRNGKQAYGWGQWATSIKYSEAKQQFYILLFSYTTGTTQVYTSKDVENGPWKKSEFRTYHDSSIFIDDDGEVYVFYGQNSFNCKHLIEEDGFLYPEPEANDPNNEGVKIISDSAAYKIPDFMDTQYAGSDKTLAELMPNASDFCIRGEGCHAYKIDGKYYLIFITWPWGDISRRCEAAFRSDNIYGPYEGMMVLDENVKFSGYTGYQGVAQGGITNAIGGNVRSSEGNWYGIIYQDRGAAGRCPMLVNVDWNKDGYEGWPMMSVSETGAIPQEGVYSGTKSLVQSDEFDNGTKKVTPEIITKPQDEDMSVQAEDGVQFNFICKNHYWETVPVTSGTVQPGEWNTISGAFTAPSDWDGGYVCINSTDYTGDFYIDDVSVKDKNGDELIYQSSMEDAGEDNVPYYWHAEGTCTIEQTKSESASGAASVLVKNRASAETGAMQYIDLTAGEEYTVSIKVKYNAQAEPTPTPQPENGYALSGNYINNSDMEQLDGGKPAYWGMSGTGDYSSNDAEYVSGTHSMKVSGRTAPSDGPMQYTSADLKADKMYKASLRIKTETADTFKLVLMNNFWQEVVGAESEAQAGEWTEISGYFKTPSDFDGGFIKICSENTSADFLIDDVCLALATETGVDIASNGNFETGAVAPWTGRYDARVEISDTAHSGSYGAYVSGRTSTGDGIQLDIGGKIDTPRDYQVSAWIMYETGPAEKTFNVTLEHVNADGSMGWTVLGSALIKKGEWTQITGNVALGQDIGTAKDNLYIETPYSANPDTENDLMPYYVDDVQLIKQPAAEWETAAPGENDYNGSNLKTVWQWNHNPDNRNWSLTERKGYLRLRTGKVVDNIQQAKNTLTQRTFGPVCSGRTSLDTSQMRNGDYAGLGALQEGYGLLAVKKYGGAKTLVIVEPESEPDDAAKMMTIPTKETYIADLNQDTVYLKTEYEFHGEEWNDYVRFYYSLDGVNWTFAYEKNNLKYHLTHFTGYKFALFNYATSSVGGYVDFDYFRVDDKLTAAGGTKNISMELSAPESVIGAPNQEYTIPVTMDSVPAGGTGIELSFAIPENSELKTVNFGSGVSDDAAYRVDGGKLLITASCYTADSARNFASLVFRTKDFVQSDTTVKLAPDYARISGESEGKEIDVNLTDAQAVFVMTKPDYGTVIKHPGIGNPLITHKYGADPFALEYNGRLYLYLTGDRYFLDDEGHITENPENGRVNNEYANGQSITVISTTDMVNWTDHGEILAAGPGSPAEFASWSWAPCVAVKNIDGEDKFFMYYTDSTYGIVVLEGDSPVGPFESPLDKHLIGWEKDGDGNYLVPGVEDCVWLFDPAVFVDDDGRAYLYFGGGSAGELDPDVTPDYENPGSARVVELGDDMISLKGDIIKIDAPCILEDSGIHKYNDKYYYSYSTNWYCNNLPQVSIAYLVSDSPTGPFKAPKGEELAGILLPRMFEYFDINSNNHHAVFEYKGEWYIAYHCGLVDTGYHTTAGYLGYRSAQIDRLTHNADGTISTVTPTRSGIGAADTLNPYKRVEAETMAWHKEKVDVEVKTVNRAGDMDSIPIEDDSQKMKTAVCGEPGADYEFNNMELTNLKNGDWSAVANADFGAGGELTFKANVKAKNGGEIKIYIDSLDGECIGTLNVTADGGGYSVLSCDTANVSGVHNVFMQYIGGDGELFDIDWWQFDANIALTAQRTADGVKAVIENSAQEPLEADLYAAAYNADNTLIYIAKLTVTAEPGETVKNIKLSAENISKIKVFLWEKDSMKSAAQAVEAE